MAMRQGNASWTCFMYMNHADVIMQQVEDRRAPPSGLYLDPSLNGLSANRMAFLLTEWPFCIWDTPFGLNSGSQMPPRAHMGLG